MMKKTKLLVIALCVIVSCCTCSAIICQAKTQERIESHSIGEPMIDVEDIIDRLVTDELVSERYNMFHVEKPEHYTFDRSIFILEYYLGMDYWGRVKSFDYKGMTSCIDYRYPTIYIPLFGDIADSQGNLSNRSFGHIKLSYNVVKDEYRFDMVLYNLSQAFRDKERMRFYEELTEYLNKTDTNADQVCLLRYVSSLSLNHEVVALIQSEQNTVILDISNSCRIQTDKDTQLSPVAYSIEEYRTLRMKVEKDIYDTAAGWENNPAGGNAAIPENTRDAHNPAVWWISIAGTIGVMIICVVVVKKQRVRKAK